MTDILAQVITGATMGCVYALIAVASSLTYRIVGTVNFTQGPMLLVAALLTASLARIVPPNWLAAQIAALVSLALVVGVLVLTEALIARRALRVGGMLGWLFATLGIGIVLQGAAVLIWGSAAVPFPDVIFTARSYLPLFGAQIPLRKVAIPAIAIAAIVLTETLLRTTLWGRAMRAASINADLAAMQGISLSRVALLAGLVSALLAGLAGLLMAQIAGPIGPAFGLRLMMLGFIAALLGGLGSTRGAIIGGLLVGLADGVIGGLLAPSAGHAILLAVLILLLTHRPRGLLGRPGIA